MCDTQSLDPPNGPGQSASGAPVVTQASIRSAKYDRVLAHIECIARILARCLHEAELETLPHKRQRQLRRWIRDRLPRDRLDDAQGSGDRAPPLS